jgi:hypothetical protein
MLKPYSAAIYTREGFGQVLVFRGLFRRDRIKAIHFHTEGGGCHKVPPEKLAALLEAGSFLEAMAVVRS